MTVTMTQRGSAPCHWLIEGEMTIYTALQLKDALLAPLDQCADLEIDLAGVTEIDSAGLQLLILGKNVLLSGHSPAVLEVLDLCKLEGFFGDPVLVKSREYPHES